MEIIADLQLHSRFSRAVSPKMTIQNIAVWAKRKGIGLVATGDWTHPNWFREIEKELEEDGNGLLRLRHAELPDKNLDPSSVSSASLLAVHSLRESEAGQNFIGSPRDVKDPLFLLATEVSSIYKQGGKVRRVHTLIWVSSLESAAKIAREMTKRGCNLLSDGRPIIGLSCIQIAELVFSIEPKALIIPAHCLLPDSMILGDSFVPKRIDAIKEGDKVLTHTGQLRAVTEVKKRFYRGSVIHVKPWYFRLGLVTTPEHPYYAIRTLKKCPSTGDMCRPSKSHLALCKRKECLCYKPEWVKAENLTIGDILVYPRSRITNAIKHIFLDVLHKKNVVISAGGGRGRMLENKLPITSELGRLVGYYLAEGSTDGNNSFAFCFSEKEQEYISDVIKLVTNLFKIEHHRVYRRKSSKGVEIIFYSKLHAQWLAHHFYIKGQKHSASNKIVPESLLHAEDVVQAECLRGWFRGDHGYTTSRVLINQMKAICLRLGIIPSVIINNTALHQRSGNHKIGTRVIKANYDLYSISNFSFFEDFFALKKDIPRSQTKLERKHGWIDMEYVYLPIKDMSRKEYEGNVYNLEVEKDHSYVAEYAVVHNCWTPWFSTFGSKSGFDSIQDAFGEYADRIYAVETGLSSSPSMNWRIKELDTRSIVSFSDAHSGVKLGREATVFEFSGQLSDFSYQHLYDAISAQSLKADDRRLKAKIAYTIEFYPEEGKYHYSGHRDCKVRYSSKETSEKGTTCPVCGKTLIQGVEQRVGELAGRNEENLQITNLQMTNGYVDRSIRMIGSKKFLNRPPFVMMVPLMEIISEVIKSPVTSPKVERVYTKLLHDVGTEFHVLLHASLSEIEKSAGSMIAEGIDRVRKGDIFIDPGFDGVFGVVKIWKKNEEGLVSKAKEQLSLTL